MDLANGRHGAPNGGVAAGAEETVVRRRKQMELVREAIHGLLDERRRDCQGEEKGLAARQQLQEEEEGLLSSLLTKLDALEGDPDSGISEPRSLHPNHQPRKGESSDEEVGLADVAKDLNKIKRQNTVTHLLLGAVIVLTAVWQVNEVSFLLWVQRKLSNPFKSLGDMIKSSLTLKGRKPMIESSPLPPVGVPDISRADLPMLVIGSTEDMDR
ncbi:hypothetical protein PAHAL_1G242200 [Panicum hallii]|uniref:Uncharacterized protein n=1 Tax=Panicum hallii TaxID=206008 RepID=A0A2S3GPS0_9POAL|nr:uncharacterized protein LOC112885912 [Panicum hallii]PAN06156.1 hypothetical protein PAHAL_1G242200 [Panicum hallii]